MYRYETHSHTYPVSKCSKAEVRAMLCFYKKQGYAGVFITNHFLDGNINLEGELSYEEKIRFYFSDYEEGVRLSDEIGIDVLCGVEMSYKGTDFLVYGPDCAWYLQHPEIMEMKMSERLRFLMESGALVIQAHPFREAKYIDHLRLFPRCVHGVEVYNASRQPFENEMAELYAARYGLPRFAGTDNHVGERRLLGGMGFEAPIHSAADFAERVKRGEGTPFAIDLEEQTERVL